MTELANHVVAENLSKMGTFDMDANELTASQISKKPDLVLIDAEHINVAVFSDFLHIYRLCGRATIYVFTESTRASSIGGTRPSALAVLRFITGSNLVGCSTGSSAGMTPWSTYQQGH